jgi:preprotein translocase subunit YajC
VSLAAASQGGSAFSIWILLALFMLAAYFLIIRPQQRRRREIQAVQSSLGPGDEIITVAGLYGTVIALDDKTVTIEVAPGVTNKYARQAVGQVVNPADRPAESEADNPATTSNDVVNPD